MGAQEMEDGVIVHNKLEFREGPNMDEACLRHLSRQMGVHEAEEMICQVLVDLAARLANLSPRRGALDAEFILAEARMVIPLAQKVGMLGLARVAESVAECAARREVAALAATLARLQRVGDRSLLEIWDFTDLA